MSTNNPEYGYLTLADISGYNAYVAGTEFEHAQEIIRDLLEFLVQKLHPVLRLVQIEGDAIFAFTPEHKITRGETLFELIENTYTDFKNQLTSIKRHHTCSCKACRNVNALDLKFFVHFGEYLEHNIDEHHGLIGYAPMFVRKRAWKEPVSATEGWNGYALFTEDSLSKLNVKPAGLKTVEFTDNPVKTFGLDLQTHFEKLLATRKMVISPEMADASLISKIDAPPAVIWEWLNDPQKRNQWWETFTHWSIRLRPEGRTGPGAVNHCNHGMGDVLETVLDWRPFDYYTVEMRINPGRFLVMQTNYLEAVPDSATKLMVCYRLKNPRWRWLAGPFCKLVASFMGFELKRLKRILTY